MRGFRATSTGISAKFDAGDAQLLAELATQLAALLSGRQDGIDDPVIARLFPAAYPDSETDAAEFRRFTEEELSDEKVRNALAIAEVLGAEPVDDKVKVKLDAANAFGWLRSLTDLRLALATRLGIEDPEVAPALDDETRATFAVYNWLGALQWSLVKAVDR